MAGDSEVKDVERVVEKARVLAGLRSACDAADEALTAAEKAAREAWEEYWWVRGDFKVGDVVQHPSLRGGGEWVIREVACAPRGVVVFVVQAVRDGVPKEWRRLGRDGLLRLVRRPI